MTRNRNRKLIPDIIRGWHLIGPGPARYGYAYKRTCDWVWLGRTKSEAADNCPAYPWVR